MGDPRAIVVTPLAKRLTQAMNYGLAGGWFSPQLPPVAQAQDTAGRRFDYISGYNISTRPRRDTGIEFQTLRNFAYYYDILRMIIEQRKDEIVTYSWTIGPTDDAMKVLGDDDDAKTVLTTRAAAATKFLKYPDGRTPWNTWLRAVIEDIFVLDAVAMWPVYKGPLLQRLEIVDPATIKLVIDDSGRRPEPPFPAFQQVLHGIPTADFLKDELLYFISNPASNRIYGLGKVEQAMVTIQIGLRRETSQLQFFTDGNVPAALVGVPDNWPAPMIKQFQETFDSILSGDTAQRRKIWFIPGQAVKNIKEFKSEESLLKTPFDEWIARILCFNFGVSPTPFIQSVNRATAETAEEKARDEGLAPTLMYIKDMMDYVLTRCMRMDGIEFKWDMEVENDPTSQATIDDTQLRNGSRGLDELRQRDGLEPLGVSNMIYLPTGPVPVHMFADGTAPNLLPPAPPAPIVHAPNAPPGGPPGAGGPPKPGQPKPGQPKPAAGGAKAGGPPGKGQPPQPPGKAPPAKIIQPAGQPTVNPAAIAPKKNKGKPASGNVNLGRVDMDKPITRVKLEEVSLRKDAPFRRGYAKSRAWYNTVTKGRPR